MNQLRKSFYFIFLIIDILSIIVSFTFSLLLSKSRLPLRVFDAVKDIRVSEIFTLMIFLITWFIFSRSIQVYDEFKTARFSVNLTILLKSIFIQAGTGIMMLFFLKDLVLSRFFLLSYLILLSVMLVFSRSLFRLIRKNLIRSGRLIKKMILVGSGKGGKEYIRFIERMMRGEFLLAGYFGEKESFKDKCKFLGSLKEIRGKIDLLKFDELVISLSESEKKYHDDILEITSEFPVRVKIIPDSLKFITNRYQLSFINNIAVVDMVNVPLEELHWRIVKRLFDLFVSVFVVLFFISWLFPLIAILIKIDSKGPVFFRQDRLGRKNRIFSLLKFRSMKSGVSDTDNEGRFRQTSKNDNRITGVGKFLRKSSLDELPQFINVLKGEMSVVGPRPHAVKHNLESKNRIENYMRRHLVKPGITGWAQVNGFRGETRTDEEMRKRVEFDMIYIENWNLFFDFKILVLTLWRLLKGDPAAY